MNKLTLQHYCLKEMGITRWQTRSASKGIAFSYLIVICESELLNGNLPNEQQQLLERMLQALKWPLFACKIVFSPLNVDESWLLQQMALFKVEKVLLFSVTLPLTDIPFAYLPSLNILLTDKIAKKQAWQAMQALI